MKVSELAKALYWKISDPGTFDVKIENYYVMGAWEVTFKKTEGTEGEHMTEIDNSGYVINYVDNDELFDDEIIDKYELEEYLNLYYGK